MPVKAAPPLAADPWNGFYIGANGGAASGRNLDETMTFSNTLLGPFSSRNADFIDALAGGRFGDQADPTFHLRLNWQWAAGRPAMRSCRHNAGTTPTLAPPPQQFP